MALNFSALQSKPKTGLNFSALMGGKPQAIPKQVTPFDATKLGIFVNTIKGLPKATKDILFPTRGFTEEELKQAKPSAKQQTLGIPRVAAEFSSIIGGALGSSLTSRAARFAQTPFGGKLADIGEKITEFGTPKTAEEAAAMRFADVVTILPIGSMKITTTGATIIAKTRNLKTIVNTLKQEIPKLTDEAAESFGKLLQNVDNVGDVQRVINKINFALQETRKVAPEARPALAEIFAPTKVSDVQVSQPNKFFVQEVVNQQGKTTFREVKGRPVDVGFGVDTFISKDFPNNQWRVTEAKTGIMIGRESKTQNEAIESAKEMLEKNKTKIDETIQTKTDTSLSPRYIKVDAPVTPKIAPETAILPKVGESLSHPEIGKIELISGTPTKGTKSGFGMAKITGDHPEVLPYLDEALQNAKIVEKLSQRDILEGVSKDKTVRIIIDHQLGKEPKTFLNNAYFVPRAGIEPATLRSSSGRSTGELPRKIKDSIISDKMQPRVTSISQAKASGQSFDEWVKGQGKPVFRGVFPNVEKFETNATGKFREYGFSVSESKDIAQKYAFELDVNQPMKLAKEGKILEGFLTPSAKIKEIRKIGVNEVKAELKVAKTQNFDGVKFIAKETGEAEIVVLNPNVLKTHSQLKAEWDGVKSRQESLPSRTTLETGRLDSETRKLSGKTPEEISYSKDTIEETKVNKEVVEAVAKKDTTKTVTDISSPKEPDTITTRKFKQTDEWKDFAKYAEDNFQDKDIYPAIMFRHTTMTAERVAEFLDGGIGGRTYREMVKPVYDSAKKMTLEGNKIKQEFDSFRILEGTKLDRDASLFGQKKLTEAPQKAKTVAEYVRGKYDEFLTRLNETRAKIGVESIPKRQDYITHINELNVLSELFGGLERVSVKAHISKLKSELLDLHPDWTDARAFDAAKRKVEGLTGVGQYVDARQPVFRFAKKRLGEYEANPSLVRSFNAYMPSALRYIHQAENVAKNKALKDVLPANAKEFTRLWNTEQVAGRQPPSFLSPVGRRALSAIRGTLGANTILGNMATTMMQLTSWPQVIALAGPVNTFYGLGSRLRSYIPGLTNVFNISRTKALRNLKIDIGLGDSLIDQILIKIGKVETLRNPAARTRQVIDVGRNFLMAIMETADQFTVGSSYMAFYRKGVLSGLDPTDAMEFADILTGKTQANYFKEAIPPFLNTIEGKTVGQFGVYGMNQWEMFRKDFGKAFQLDEKNPKSVARVFKQFLVFLTAAYMIDWASEETFGRQPYDIKELVDDSIGFAKEELTGKQLFDTSKGTVATYIPFMGSVKFGSMPPVIEFGKDVIGATLGTGKTQEDAIGSLQEKWVYNILMPYAGNQARKSLQGAEAVTKIDLPFVRNPSKDIDIETIFDQAKAILFGPYATKEAITFFENRDKREAIKDKYEIIGTITSDENITKLKEMSKEEFELYTAGYAESTLKTINNKLGKSKSKPSFVGRPSLEEIFR